MKKMQFEGLGEGLDRNQMKLVNGGGARPIPNYNGNNGICKGVWIDCLCMNSAGKPYVCRSCAPLNSGQC
jgi:hypothetical protein